MKCHCVIKIKLNPFTLKFIYQDHNKPFVNNFLSNKPRAIYKIDN